MDLAKQGLRVALVLSVLVNTACGVRLKIDDTGGGTYVDILGTDGLVLGVYPTQDVSEIEFEHAGGFPLPYGMRESRKLVIPLRLPSQAKIVLTTAYGTSECPVNLSEVEFRQLIANLESAYLRISDPQYTMVDAGNHYLRVNYRSKAYEHIFEGGDTFSPKTPRIAGEPLLNQLARIVERVGCVHIDN